VLTWIPATPLNNDQMERRVAVFTKFKEQTKNDPYAISTIITGDESWVYRYDSETQQQSSQWKTSNSPCPKTAQVRN
jgi:hypothetical protein